MTIKQLVEKLSGIQNEYSVAFAKKIDGEFTRDSEVIIAEIDEESDEDIAKSFLEKNPEFNYFLEVFIIKDMVEDLPENFGNIDQIVDRIIHYAKYDA
jgi:hypothetical protein